MKPTRGRESGREPGASARLGPAHVGPLILAGVLAAPLAWLLITKALRAYPERLEKRRVPLLKRIAAAQAQFRERDLDRDGLNDFGTLGELLEADLISSIEVQKAGSVSAAPSVDDSEHRWWAAAEPLHPGQGRAFFINHTGAIYYAARPFASTVNDSSCDPPAGVNRLAEH